MTVGTLGIALEMGTFVLLDKIMDRNYYSVGRILSWYKARNAGTRIRIQLVHLTDRNLVNPAGDPGVLWQHMGLARWTNHIVVASPGHIMQVAWVFPPSLLCNPAYPAQGRRTCFAILDETVSPFPCSYKGECRLATSYAKQVWQDLDQIYLVLKKMVLSDAKRLSKRACIPISNNGWKYLYKNSDLLARQEDDDCEAFSKGDGVMTKVEFEMFPGFDYSSVRKKYTYDRVIFTGSLGMFAVCALLGEGSFLGIKKRKPSLAACKKGPLFVSENDNCLYGTKLVLTYFRGQLVIDFTYAMWQYRANEKGVPINCPDCSLERYLRRTAYPGDDLRLYPAATLNHDIPGAVLADPEEEDSHEVSLILRVGNTFPMGEKDELYRIANNRLNDAGDVLFVPVDADCKLEDVTLNRDEAIFCARTHFFD